MAAKRDLSLDKNLSLCYQESQPFTWPLPSFLAPYVSVSDACFYTRDGGEFPVHRLPLHNVSRYFEVYFLNSERDVKILVNIDKITLELILYYVYTGEFRVTKSHICRILTVADFWIMEDLIEECIEFIEKNTTIKICMEVYLTSLSLSHLNLVNHSYKFIQRNFEKIVKETCDIAMLPFESLIEFLTDDYLCVANEITIWEAIVDWVVLGDSEDRKELVYQLLSFIRFNDIDSSYIEGVVMTHSLIDCNDKCLRQIKDHSDKIKSGILERQGWWDDLGFTCINTNSRNPKSIYYFVELFTEFSDDNIEGCAIFEMYDDSFDYWRTVGSQQGFVPDYLFVMGDTLYLFDTFRKIHFAFKVTNRRWEALTPLDEDKYEYSIVMVNNKIYSVGGVQYDPQYLPMKTVDVYNAELNIWIPVESMKFAHLGPATELNGNIYVAGDSFDTLHNMYALSCERYLLYPSKRILFTQKFAKI